MITFIRKRANRIKNLVNYFCARRVFVAYPPEMGIELTSHCNLECVMCPHGIMERSKGFMTWETYKKIIDEIKDYSEFIFLHGIGESLLHKDLVSWVGYAADNGLSTSLSTNITYLNEEVSRKILGSKLEYITLALDGGTKETYESIRVKGDFEQVVANIKIFLRNKREIRSKIHVTVQLILMEENWHEKEQFMNLFSLEEKKAIDDFRIKPYWDDFRGQGKPGSLAKPCFYLWNMMSVFWDGKVPLCCIDYNNDYGFGDASSRSIRDIWSSGKIEETRAAHSKKDVADYNICSTCSVPEQEYFAPTNLIIGALLGARAIRKLIPIYEKLFMNRSKFTKTR